MDNKKTTRRQFLKTSAASMAGMAGILAFRQPPVFGGQGEMKYLGRNYFIKEFDQTLRKQAKAEWRSQISRKHEQVAWGFHRVRVLHDDVCVW